MAILRIEIVIAFALGFAANSLAQAGTEGMPSMPVAHESATKTATGQDEVGAGFGADEPLVRARTMMMVEGEGAESQAPVAVAPGAPVTDPCPYEFRQALSPTEPQTGPAEFTFEVIDHKTGHEIAKIPFQARVEMSQMKMGMDTPAVTEARPGRYSAHLFFSMKGKWRLSLQSPVCNKAFEFAVGEGASWRP